MGGRVKRLGKGIKHIGFADLVAQGDVVSVLCLRS